MQEVDENWKMKWKYVHYCKIMFTRWERDTHWRENDGSVGNLKAELQTRALRLPTVLKTIERIEQGRNKTKILPKASNIQTAVESFKFIKF